MQGIYQIKNLINGKCYVGQSIDIERRFYNHRTTTLDYPLYRDIKKYGIDNFEFSVLEEVEHEDLLTQREMFWYDLINPEYNNISPQQNASNGLQKSVLQIDKKTLEVLNEYQGVNEAARKVGGFAQNISYVCNGKLRSANGYYWCYTEEHTQEWKPKKHPKHKKVHQLDKKTLSIINTYETITQAAKAINGFTNAISKACKNPKRSSNGYRWCYTEDYNNRKL
jgi:group I intron endonuclease